MGIRMVGTAPTQQAAIEETYSWLVANTGAGVPQENVFVFKCGSINCPLRLCTHTPVEEPLRSNKV